MTTKRGSVAGCAGLQAVLVVMLVGACSACFRKPPTTVPATTVRPVTLVTPPPTPKTACSTPVSDDVFFSINSHQVIFTSQNFTLVENSTFNATYKSWLLIHDYSGVCSSACSACDFSLSKLNDTITRQIQDDNVIVVDWKAANGPDYATTAGRATCVADEISSLIQSLQAPPFNLNTNNLHIVGIGMGSHIAGMVGSINSINRITGLDPSGEVFDDQSSTNGDVLSPHDAEFVDVIITNEGDPDDGFLGSIQTRGHVNIFVNGGAEQDDCVQRHGSGTECSHQCSHQRAASLFEKSVAMGDRNRYATAASCHSATNNNRLTVRFGNRIQTDAIGDYCITTEGNSLYYAYKAVASTSTSWKSGAVDLRVRYSNDFAIISEYFVFSHYIEFFGPQGTRSRTGLLPIGVELEDMSFYLKYVRRLLSTVNNFRFKYISFSRVSTGETLSRCNITQRTNNIFTLFSYTEYTLSPGTCWK